MTQVYGPEPRTIFQAAVAAVSPAILVSRAIQFDPSNGTVIAQGVKYFVDHNVKVVAFGKAVLGMVGALERLLGDHIVEGVASVPSGLPQLAKLHHPEWLPAKDSRIRICEGAPRNIADCSAERAARDILRLVQCASDQDLLIVLISGGGSALLPCPVEGVTLDEKIKGSQLLAAAGATIRDINNFRKCISLVKGGRLAEASYPKKLLVLVLSDVIGDPLDIIASGPTVPNTIPPQAVLRTIDAYGLRNAMPTSIIQHLQKNHASSSGSHLAEHVYQNVQNVVIGNNQMATAAAAQRAKELGYNVYVWSHCIEGEARTLGEVYAKVAMALVSSSSSCSLTSFLPDGFHPASCLAEDLERFLTVLSSLHSQLPLCIIGAGEPTVRLRGAGRGGRNQELALAVAIWLDRLVRENPSMAACDIQFLSAGTDGEDGPCDVAGAVVDTGVVKRAGDEGINPQAHLDNNDSYGFFSKLSKGQHHINTGLTGTNVMDIHLLCVS